MTNFLEPCEQRSLILSDNTAEPRVPPMSEPSEVTGLLKEVRQGNQDAFNRVFSIVYGELRRLAAYYMRQERPDHTLQTTALVHEAYVRLVGRETKNWEDRKHFFSVAAEVMRSLLVDHARAHRAAKREGAGGRVPLDENLSFNSPDLNEVLALDTALKKLSEADPRQAQIVELRYFAGLGIREIADVLGISERTVIREWNMAKAWLYGEMNPQ